MNKAGIMGGGIIGLSSAYYLTKAGFKVTVFDSGDLVNGCSYGNAGMIVPSHIIPLAAPGMISKGFRWMFDSSSPFYVRPRLSADLFRWGYQFYRHSNEKHVKSSIPALKDISLLSKSMFRQWKMDLPFDFGFQERGLLMLYQNAGTEKEEIEMARVANHAGIEAHVLSVEEIQKLEPDVKVTARGGVYYPGDAQVTPHVLMRELIVHLKAMGVTFRSRTSIESFVIEQGRIKAGVSGPDNFEMDEWVLSAGSWSGQLCQQLGIRLPMQAGKGYSFTLPSLKKNTRIPTIFIEPRVAVTPMGDALRFGGTMEIGGLDQTINLKRVGGIVKSISNFYPDLEVSMPKPEDIWSGLRPCSPDGLPYIGRSSTLSNLIVATGHSMMGISLGPGTGKLVSEIAMKESTSIPVHAFEPERYN